MKKRRPVWVVEDKEPFLPFFEEASRHRTKKAAFEAAAKLRRYYRRKWWGKRVRVVKR